MTDTQVADELVKVAKLVTSGRYESLAKKLNKKDIGKMLKDAQQLKRYLHEQMGGLDGWLEEVEDSLKKLSSTDFEMNQDDVAMELKDLEEWFQSLTGSMHGAAASLTQTGQEIENSIKTMARKMNLKA